MGGCQGVGFAISMFKGPQYQQRPWGHNIKHVHGVTISNKCIWSQYQCHWYCDPMSHPQTLPNLTIDIMHPWTIDIVHMLLVQGFAISMPLILWPHVQIQNLAKIVPLILWPHGTLILWLVFGVTISMTKKPQYQWLITLQFTTKFYYLTWPNLT